MSTERTIKTDVRERRLHFDRKHGKREQYSTLKAKCILCCTILYFNDTIIILCTCVL